MRLDCECGFVAQGTGGDELVAVAQAHAWDVHLVDLTAEVLLGLAGVSADRSDEGASSTIGAHFGKESTMSDDADALRRSDQEATPAAIHSGTPAICNGTPRSDVAGGTS